MCLLNLLFPWTLETRSSTFGTSISWEQWLSKKGYQVVQHIKAKHRTVTHNNSLPMDVLEQPNLPQQMKKKVICYYFLTKDEQVILR